MFSPFGGHSFSNLSRTKTLSFELVLGLLGFEFSLLLLRSLKKRKLSELLWLSRPAMSSHELMTSAGWNLGSDQRDLGSDHRDLGSERVKRVGGVVGGGGVVGFEFCGGGSRVRRP